MNEQQIMELINESEVAGLKSQIDFLQGSITITLTVCAILVAILAFWGGYVIKGIKKQQDKAKEVIDEAKELHKNAQKHIGEAHKQREELKEEQSEISSKQKELTEFSERIDEKIEQLEKVINSKELDEKLKQIDELRTIVEGVKDKVVFERKLGEVKMIYDLDIDKYLQTENTNEAIRNIKDELKYFEHINYIFQTVSKQRRDSYLQDLENLHQRMKVFINDRKN